jgi:hypothetical protein
MTKPSLQEFIKVRADERNDAELVEKFLAVREERLLADKHAADLKTQETELKLQIINELRDRHLTAIGADSGITTLTCKKKPQATDWTLIYNFMYEQKAFHLLHKRLTEEAIREYWQEGIPVPGVTEVDIYDLTISKAKVKHG